MRILIIGASGSGTTTVGAALAERLQLSHIESDDLFWIPSDPPYMKYHRDEKLMELVDTHLVSTDNWVLSGSPCEWGDAIMPLLDLAVFLDVDTDERIARIKQREEARFGSRIAEGGDMYDTHLQFLDWTARYDHGNISGRSRAKHDLWLSSLTCPILRAKNQEADEILSSVLKEINAAR